MHSKNILFSLFALTLIASACSSPEADYSKETELNTLVDSVSYSLGFQSGDRLSSQGFPDVEVEKFVAGFIGGLDKDDSKIPSEELQALFARFSTYILDKIKFENLEAGKAFLAENKLKEGVVETPSGLQYLVVEPGTGPSPTPQDSVRVQYEGSLTDGTVFESTYVNGSPGNPAQFLLGAMISGWIEGIQLMNEGSTYIFYIPSELAYGENPRPGSVIQPNHTLVFKVKLEQIR